MLLWNDLKNKNIKLYRKPEIQKRYDIFTKKIIKKHNNYYEYIIKEILQNRKIHITLNKFPYYLDKSISHWIIWDLVDCNMITYKKMVNKIFNPKYYDIIYRINKKEHQSIPEIKHCHLFIKMKN
jgi:hypothetical protein